MGLPLNRSLKTAADGQDDDSPELRIAHVARSGELTFLAFAREGGLYPVGIEGL